MKVLKFGGTSVGSVQSIQTLLDILRQEIAKGENPVVVLSAMSGVTNLLVDMAEKAASGSGFSEQLIELEKRHFDVIKKLIGVQKQNPVFTRLKLFFNELEDLLQGVHSLRELTSRTRDLILSYGERCSTVMISKIAEQYFPNALFADASELIKTDDNYG